MTRQRSLAELSDREWRIYLRGVPVARTGWSDRWYRIAEALTIPAGIALILFVAFFTTWTGQ